MTHTPLAYTGDADIYCPDCAAERYGDKVLTTAVVLDHEGNEVSVAYSWDLRDWDYPPACGDCGKGLGER